MDSRSMVMNLYFEKVASCLNHFDGSRDVCKCPCIGDDLDPLVSPAASSIHHGEKIFSYGRLPAIEFDAVAVTVPG
jgi:hypothetical protein